MMVLPVLREGEGEREREPFLDLRCSLVTAAVWLTRAVRSVFDLRRSA